jgi:hypothetical protein
MEIGEPEGDGAVTMQKSALKITLISASSAP